MTSDMEFSMAISMMRLRTTVLTMRSDSMMGTPEASRVPSVRANLATDTFRKMAPYMGKFILNWSNLRAPRSVLFHLATSTARTMRAMSIIHQVAERKVLTAMRTRVGRGRTWFMLSNMPTTFGTTAVSRYMSTTTEMNSSTAG